MKINFRQGLISYQQSGAQAVFLLPGTVANNVSLSIAPQPTIATIAHGSSDYLLKFDQTVLNAWQLEPGVDNWLFIDQNLISGALTYGITTFEPITSAVEPGVAAAGQLWFDLNATVMKTFNGAKWIDTPRLVVAKVVGGNTNQIQSYSTGSSVGLFVSGSPGFLMLDSQLRPLRTSSGELLTSDTAVRIKTTVGTSGVLSEPVTGFVPIRANQAIPAMSLVYFSGEDSVSLASSDPSLVDLKTPVGIIEYALATNEVGTLTQIGELTYDQWDFQPEQFGKPLYCGYNGQLTATRPQGIQAYRVAYIKNAKTILFYVDSETQPQVVSSPGAIISGTPPINAVTSLNGSGEIVTAVSMNAATSGQAGYMTQVQATQLGSFETRISMSEDEIGELFAEKADIAHTHVVADVIGLQTDLDALTTSVGLKIPKILGTTGNFPSINFDGTLLDSGYTYSSFAPLGHVHTIADVTDLQTEINEKANVVHTHVIDDVIDLQTDLDARAFVNHTHLISDVSGLQTAIDNKANLVHAHEIIDINGLQEQLDLRTLVGHSHIISDITNLQTTLNSKANSIHTHVIADTIGLQSALDGKAAVVHTHVAADVTDFTEAVQDVVATTIVAGTGISAVYNDAGNELVISSSVPPGTQLKIRDNDTVGYAEYEPTVALAFPMMKVAQVSSGLISVKPQKLSMFQGLTPLAIYPNANVNAETQIIFGMGLQATLSGDDDEIVTIHTASQSPPTFPGGGLYQVMGNDGAGYLIPLAMNIQTDDPSFTTSVNIGENTHGNVSLFTTTGDGTSGNGGNFRINAGNAPQAGPGHGGDLTLLGGAGSLEGTEGLGGGNVFITGGRAGEKTGDDNSGGFVKIQTGQSQVNVADLDSSFISLQSTDASGAVKALVLNQWGAVGFADGDVTDYGMATYGTLGQILQSNGPNAQPTWEAAPSSGAGATALDQLTDVTLVSLADNDKLIYNGVTTKWENIPDGRVRVKTI
jgi:Phage tail repeat like